MENEDNTPKYQSLETELNTSVSDAALTHVTAMSEMKNFEDSRKRAGGKRQNLTKVVKAFVASFDNNPRPLPENPRKPGEPYLRDIALEIGCSAAGLFKSKACMKLIKSLAVKVGLTAALRPPRKTHEFVAVRLEKWMDAIRAAKKGVPRSYIHPEMPDFAAIERHLGIGRSVLSDPGLPHREKIMRFVADVGLDAFDVSKASGPVTIDEVEAAAVRENALTMVRQGKTPKQIDAESGNIRWATGKVRGFITGPKVSAEAAIDQALVHYQTDENQRKLVAVVKRLKSALEVCRLVGNLPPDFDQALDALIVRVGVPIPAVARSVGLHPGVLRGWADGAGYPGPTTRFALPKLEEFFQVPAGTLVDRCLLRQRPQSPHKNVEKEEAVPEVNESNAADDSDETDRTPEYAYQPEVRSLPIIGTDRTSRWPRQLRCECDAFLTYRTDPNPPFGIKRSSEWSLWSLGTVGIREPELGRFFGFLASKYNQLCRLTEEELSFVLVLCPELLHHFLNHRKNKRAEKTGRVRITNNDFALLLVARNLVHPSYGWLTQQPAMATKLRPLMRAGSDEWLIPPDDYELAQRNWTAYCQRAYSQFDDLCATTQREVEVENEHAAIRAILILHDPLAAFDLGTAGLKEELAYLDKNSCAYHLSVRDAVMWLIQTQCALRRKNIAGLELDDLTLQEDGIWHLHLDNRKMKNHRSSFYRHDKKVYDLDIDLLDHDGLYDLIVEWRNISRPLLLKGRKSESFFIGKDGSDLDEPGVVQAVQRVYGVYIMWNPETRTGIQGAEMAAIHWMRSVLCTGLLKQTGSFEIAADAIADSVETVKKHYARYLPADRARTVRNVLQNRKDSLSE